MSSARERRKTTVKTESSFTRDDKSPSVLLTTTDKSFKLTRFKNKSQQLSSSKNIYFQIPQKILKPKHEQARREKQKQERYNEYQRVLKKQKKYEASLKFLANQKEQLMMRRSASKFSRKESTPKHVNRLFVQEFNQFQQNKQIKQHQNDWEQILLKVDKRKQEKVTKSRSKLRQPYQRLISKYRALNKQNYDYDNIKGINYCKGIKHQIKRASSSCHMRSKSQKRVCMYQNPSNDKPQKFLKSTLIMPTKNIIEMCKDYNFYARNLKKSMDGFQIYCNRFNHILQKKKAALFVDEF